MQEEKKELYYGNKEFIGTTTESTETTTISNSNKNNFKEITPEDREAKHLKNRKKKDKRKKRKEEKTKECDLNQSEPSPLDEIIVREEEKVSNLYIEEEEDDIEENTKKIADVAEVIPTTPKLKPNISEEAIRKIKSEVLRKLRSSGKNEENAQ